MADIKIENLKYKYPESEGYAINNINIEIPQGQFVIIVGGSGSGKSTLLRAISNLIPEFHGGSYSGKVSIDNVIYKDIENRDFVQKIGMVFQNPESQIVMTNVEEEIVFGLENIGLSNSLMKRRVMEVSSALNISSNKKSSINELSGGQKQKVALASVLAMQPEVLVLDEPTSQLDPISGEEIITMVRRLNEENGITVILTEQKLERCFHLADRIIVMEKGEIIHDSCDLDVTAKWAVEEETPFILPISKLFASNKFSKIPSTVKDARGILKEYKIDKEDSLITNRIELDKKDNSKELVIDIKNLWHIYENGTEALIDNTFEVNKGEIVTIMGENGSGKTTLLKNINGLLKSSRGKINIYNEGETLSENEYPISIGYLSQNPNDYLFLNTAEEEIAFTMKTLNKEDYSWTEELMNTLGIAKHRKTNPRDLSTGERQRVALAAVLAVKPKILLLDEPTRGLDYDLKQQLGEIILELQKSGTTIVMVSHDVEFAAEYSDEIILLDKGEIVDKGNKYNLLSNSTGSRLDNIWFFLVDSFRYNILINIIC